VVRTSEISQGTTFCRHCRELVDRLCGVLLSGTRESDRLREFTAFQLKIIQEVITLCVFVVFAWWYLGEGIRWNHAVSFLFLIGAVTFAFWGKL
jgi:hypothetical protein